MEAGGQAIISRLSQVTVKAPTDGEDHPNSLLIYPQPRLIVAVFIAVQVQLQRMEAARLVAGELTKGIHMKRRILVPLIGLLLILAACQDRNHIHGPGQNIHGSGNLVTETRQLASFNSLEINTVADVQLNRSATQQVTVTVDDNVMQYIITRVDSGVFTLSTDPDVSLSDFTLTIHITIPDLASVTVNSVASVISGDSFNADDLLLTMNSVGTISLNIAAREVFSTNNSVGTIDLRGTTVIHRAVVSSVGSITAFELATDTTLATANSVGSAYVRANDFLRATINSTGSIYYRGHPEIQLIDNGTGSLIDAN